MTRIYKTARGVPIDMGKLINQNETTIAVGNMNVNARGDKIGPGGKVIKQRDEIIGTNVPNQINVKQTPVIGETPKDIKKTKKDVSNMDPEGEE